MNDFDFTWDYRIVNEKSANGGEDWYCIKEVIYNLKGEPQGFSAPCLGSEDMESFKRVWDMVQKGMTLPPLQEEDFETVEDY